MRECYLEEEEVHIDRKESREDDERESSHKLVDVFIGDDGERRWIVELMMGLVDVPAGIDGVTHAMVEELEEVRGQPNDKETEDQITPTESAETTVTVQFASTHQMQSESRTKCGREETFEHQDDFHFHAAGRWIFRIGFLLPLLKGNFHIVMVENDRREEDEEEQGDPRQNEIVAEQRTDFTQHFATVFQKVKSTRMGAASQVISVCYFFFVKHDEPMKIIN